MLTGAAEVNVTHDRTELLVCHAQMGNKGAYITFKGGDMVPAFTTYSQVPHPDVRPMAFAGGLMASLMGM